MVLHDLKILPTTTFKRFIKIEENESKYKFSKNKKNEDFEVWGYKLKNVVFNGENLFYPNVVAYSYNSQKEYKIINEKIMSLEKKTEIKSEKYKNYKEITNQIDTPVFFFIYNSDNYYHYIYDTLPYLISFLKLKKNIPELKLLMNYPNESINKNYKFIDEPLRLLGINDDDILIIKNSVNYSTVYISTSYTHSEKKNSPPKPEIYKFYKKLISKVPKNNLTPKKIYISRRVTENSDFSNIGTNYTTRRVLVNENEVVDFVKSMGFVEVFTENLSFIDKVNLFRNADSVIGSIGGGLCNVLFSSKKTTLYCLVSPFFLDINYRFLYSFKNVNLILFTDSFNTEDGEFKKNMRIQTHNNIIGEIIQVNDKTVKIAYVDKSVSGWNLDSKFTFIEINKTKCIKLDNGLNSSWKINFEKFKTLKL
jgi:hypothetical protein